jgi:DNA-binding MltR family transcriptional regulator
MLDSDTTIAIKEFLEEFQGETDRAAAVLGAAYLDSRLEVLLREKFVALPDFVEQLFHGQGALSSFSARISICYAIGLISRQAAEDLHIIRKIRNDFAHKPHGLSFETPTIADRVSNIRIVKSFRLEGQPFSFDDTSIRYIFNVAVATLLINGIEYRIEHTPKFQEVTAAKLIRLTRG